MSFECARCHEYVAGPGTDPPQFCSECGGQRATCVTCKVEFDWDMRSASLGSPCSCISSHGEFRRDNEDRESEEEGEPEGESDYPLGDDLDLDGDLEL